MTLDSTGLSGPRIVATEKLEAPNAVLKKLDGVIEWKGGIQASLDACPRWLTQNATLTIPAGIYEEDVLIKNFIGALNIKLSVGTYINGGIKIESCTSVKIYANALNQTTAIYPRNKTPFDASAAIYIVDTCGVSLENLYISGYRGRTSTSNGSAYTIYTLRSHVWVRTCSLEYSTTAAILADTTQLYVTACIGGTSGSNASTNANLGYNVRASCGGFAGISGTNTMSVSGNNASGTATVVGGTGAKTAGGMNDPTATWVTRTFTPSRICTYYYGDHRYDGGNMSQGYYGSYVASETNWRRAAIWFSSASTTLVGKQIQKAEITLRRSSGGWSRGVDVYLRTVNLAEADYNTTTRPDLDAEPTSLPPYPAGALNREQEGTYDITNLMPAFIQGHAIGLYEPKAAFDGSWSPEYTNFYGLGSDYVPTLTVTYK